MKTKRTLKKWAYYKWKKMLVRLRRKSKSVMTSMDPHKPTSLNEIQKPLYDIAVKLINDPNTELRSNSIDYTFHIESESYLVILRSNNISTENYSISLIELNNTSQTPVFVDIPFPQDHVKSIIEKFDREVQKRMKNRQTLKTTKVANRLQTILKEIELRHS
jgi:hypothetical protein